MSGAKVILLECRDRSISLVYQQIPPYLLKHLLSFSLCLYCSGDLEGLPDPVTVASLLDKFDTNFSFGVAIMSRH
jgi:hypothetical protein